MDCCCNSKNVVRGISLKGGGRYGVVEAVLLQRIEEELGLTKALAKATAFAGSSTGSLVAACLALGIRPAKIVELYKTKLGEIFHRSWWRWLRSPAGARYAKYDSGNLAKVVREVLGDSSFGDLQRAGRNLIVTAIRVDDPVKGVEGAFISSFPGREKWNRMPVWEAAAASCAEPYYFSERAIPGFGRFVGGGLLANDPALSLAEDITNCTKASPSVLSIGSGEHPIAIPDGDLGLFDWAPHLVPLVLTVSVGAVHYHMQSRFGKAGRYHQVNPIVKKRYPMDGSDAKTTDELIEIANQVDLTETAEFLSRW